MAKKPQRDGRSFRARIQAQLEIEEQKRKKESFQKRLELAREGVRKYQRGEIGEAVRHFRLYLQILEDWKDVPEDGLGPEHLNVTLDSAELLLVSGVYWDLAKIYDKAKGQEDFFRKYLRKYVQFSKGMPYQTVSAETLRKFIHYDQPYHVDDFKLAYQNLAGSKRCFVASALVGETRYETLSELKRFRDETLLRSVFGRAFVWNYYTWVGPLGAKLLWKSPRRLRRLCAGFLDWFATKVT